MNILIRACYWSVVGSLNKSKTVMRKVMLGVAIVLAGMLSAEAQDIASKKKDALKEQGEKIQKDEDASGGDADMVPLKAAEVPGVLRKVLQSKEYRGWDAETSSIYGSEENDLFVVEIREGKKARTFYFDGEGKPIMN